ncbi:MAG: hypothetical protein AAF197_00635 [Pseudomonadota bacterium]
MQARINTEKFSALVAAASILLEMMIDIDKMQTMVDAVQVVGCCGASPSSIKHLANRIR